MQYILGINAFHGDSSACLLCDGKLVAAAEEERFRRLKHWAGFPSMAIQYCLSEAGIGIEQVTHVAINQDHKAHFWKKVAYTLSVRPSLSALLDRILNKKKRASIKSHLIECGFTGFSGKIHSVEHHLSHLASAFYVSPFREAAVVSVDGFGDFSSAAWGYGCEDDIKVDERVYFPHSLGIFYQALTQWLGFFNYGDEYKVMGLAPYGEPIYKQQLGNIVSFSDDGTYALNLDYFRHHNEKIMLEWAGDQPSIGILFSQKLVELLGPARNSSDEILQYHKDVARSVQALYEDALMNLLKGLHQKYGSDNLCLAGGCAMNSVANGKIYQNTGFKKIYIQSAAGDAGGAIGAAYSIWHKLGGERNFIMEHSYWGPSYSKQNIKNLLDQNQEVLLVENCKIYVAESELNLCKKVAQYIADGKVIGWFQGRMEWGPRALGNRSILGDPRRDDMKDILNLKIKRRESFRPFAPSILRECVPEWFETDDDVPFMMQVFKIKLEKCQLIPAVAHVDGSGRLQTVTAETNLRYYNLIQAFKEITGVPIILNTSFNENEPVVCAPKEALDCFLRTKMDILVLGDYIIERANP
jgi:carbamoyltransferase